MTNVVKLIFVFTVIASFVSCSNDDSTPSSVTINYLKEQLNEAKAKITELEEENESLSDQYNMLRSHALTDKNELNRLAQIVDALTRMEAFEYEILSEQIDRPPYDTVVYIADVPEKLDEQEMVVIKSAVLFSGEKYAKVSLWKDRETAMQYIHGEYDPDEGVLGWSGFDQRFGIIDNSSNPPSLRHFFSRDDGQMLEFGKYKFE